MLKTLERKHPHTKKKKQIKRLKFQQKERA